MAGRIREALLDDAHEMARLSVQLGYSVSLERMRSSLQSFLDDPERFVFVVESENKIVGWMGARLDAELTSEPYLLISGLVVDEDSRGEGHGKALINHAFALADQLGVEKVRLRMNEKRTEAHDFYVRLGFEEIKRQVVFERLMSV
ncbi:MAG: GNAT family N-acetyltransferase [Fimbriimonadaceae bacterium]|nr:GNAT family N-acetyltransferase [Fimbriimonadaceae bacterium]